MTNEYAMKRRKMNDAVDTDFHAGQFLREVMRASGHDEVWLSIQTGMDQKALEALLNQSNMDARLFVEVGERMQPLFFQRVDEMVFGKNATSPVN